MSTELSLVTTEALRAEAREILDRLPAEALEPVTELLRSFEMLPGESEAETLSRFFTSLSAELYEAVESVRAARAGLNALTDRLAQCKHH